MMLNVERKIVNVRKEITDLEEKLEKLYKIQERNEENCPKHEWGETEFVPEWIKKEEIERYAGTCDDIVPIYKEVSVKKDRWKRECKICGKVQYGYELEPVVVKEEPKWR